MTHNILLHHLDVTGHSNLNAVKIGVTDTRPDVASGPSGIRQCVYEHEALPTGTTYLKCDADRTGRYLVIQLVGKKKTLTLCEVRVTGCESNAQKVP